ALHVIRVMGADGADYCAVEWRGETVAAMGLDERLTLCNLSTDFGAKAGMVEPADAVVVARNPEYRRVLDVDASALRPQVAVHPAIDNVHDIDEVAGTPLDQVFIGSCTNGRLSDLAEAAAILRGHRVHERTRTVVVPASRRVYVDALQAGYIETFALAGALVLNPGCGPCLGRQHGVVGPGEN